MPLHTESETEATKTAARFMRDRQGTLEQYRSFLRGELDRIRRMCAEDELQAFTLDEIWEKFLASPGRPKSGAGTLKHYKSAWTQFASGLPATRKGLGDVTHKDATDRMEAIYKSGLAQGTADKHLIYLKAIFRALLPKGINNPFEGVIARGAEDTEDMSFLPVNLTQTKELLAAVKRQKKDKLTDEEFHELYTVFFTLVYTGLRMSDACELLIEEVYFDRDVLIVRANKTSRKKRGATAYAKIGMHPALREILTKQIGDRESGPVFPLISAIGKPRQSRWVQIIFKRAGVERKVSSSGGMRNRYGASSFRHQMQDRLSEAGIAQKTINVIMCHSDQTMGAVYTTTTDKGVYDAIVKAYPDVRT